jgi:hypothetical protein
MFESSRLNVVNFYFKKNVSLWPEAKLKCPDTEVVGGVA